MSRARHIQSGMVGVVAPLAIVGLVVSAAPASAEPEVPSTPTTTQAPPPVPEPEPAPAPEPEPAPPAPAPATEPEPAPPPPPLPPAPEPEPEPEPAPEPDPEPEPEPAPAPEPEPAPPAPAPAPEPEPEAPPADESETPETPETPAPEGEDETEAPPATDDGGETDNSGSETDQGQPEEEGEAPESSTPESTPEAEQIVVPEPETVVVPEDATAVSDLQPGEAVPYDPNVEKDVPMDVTDAFMAYERLGGSRDDEDRGRDRDNDGRDRDDRDRDDRDRKPRDEKGWHDRDEWGHDGYRRIPKWRDDLWDYDDWGRMEINNIYSFDVRVTYYDPYERRHVDVVVRKGHRAPLPACGNGTYTYAVVGVSDPNFAVNVAAGSFRGSGHCGPHPQGHRWPTPNKYEGISIEVRVRIDDRRWDRYDRVNVYDCEPIYVSGRRYDRVIIGGTREAIGIWHYREGKKHFFEHLQYRPQPDSPTFVKEAPPELKLRGVKMGELPDGDSQAQPSSDGNGFQPWWLAVPLGVAGFVMLFWSKLTRRFRPTPGGGGE